MYHGLVWATTSVSVLLLLLPTTAVARRAASYGPIAGSPPQILPCDASSPAQQWLVNAAPGGGGGVQLTATIVYANRSCLEVNPQLLRGVNVTLVSSHCSFPASSAQTFTWDSAALTVVPQAFIGPSYTMCVALAQGGTVLGTQVWAENCTGAPSQRWAYDASSRAVRSLGAPGMCLDIGSAWAPCAPGTRFAAMPFCDAALPLDARLDDMLARMPFHEALQQTQGNSASAPSIGRSPWAESDFTHSMGAPFVWSYDALAARGATVYPAASAIAQSFNKSLWREIGLAVGDEVRAGYNSGNNGLLGWSPNVNIARDPRWGRINEVTGEDPFLTGEYAGAYVAAMQWGEAYDGAPADTRGVLLKTANTCKHFAGYSLELWNGTVRYAFNAVISRQDLYASYLPAFQACVEVAKVAALMCSYNQINGVPACADAETINGIARGVWGLDGAVSSDCGAAKAVWQTDHFTNSSEAVCGLVLNAGMDWACSNDLLPLQCADRAIADGTLSRATVDTAIRRKMAVRLRLGEFDDATPWDALSNDTLVCSPESLARAQRAAEQSVSLLKVDRARLPLRRAAVRSVAVVGPNAQATGGSLLGDYSAWPCGGLVPTLVDAVTAAGFDARFAQGCAINSSDASGIGAAEAAAAAADATLVVVGLDLSVEREGLDRYEIGWPGVQASLIARACAAAKGPCVVLIVGAGSIDVSAELANADVAAIFKLAYPGIRGAAAAVRVVFGDVEPAGRLTATTYAASYVNEISMFEFSLPPTTSEWPCCIGCAGTCATPGRTYKHFTGAPVLPFGWGLGYATFEYTLAPGPTAVSLASTAAFLAANTVPGYGATFAPLRGAPAAANFTLTVHNTGARDADDVVLAFLRPPHAGEGGIPLAFLFAFERVHVLAGGAVDVHVTVSARDLSQVIASGARVAWGGEYVLECGLAGAPAQGGGYASAAFTAAAPAAAAAAAPLHASLPVLAAPPLPLDLLRSTITAMTTSGVSAFFAFNYGPGYALAALVDASPSAGEWTPFVSQTLDALLAAPGSWAYNLSQGHPVPFTGAVGEPTAMALAFLARAQATGTPRNGADWVLALRVADEEMLRFPYRLPDGTFMRPAGWGAQPGNLFYWQDDSFMSTALLARLARAGAPNASAYLAVATTNALTNARLVQHASGLFPHGWNPANAESSCCAWGRANGWSAMALVELLTALDPAAPARAGVLDSYQRLMRGALATQSADGRWHQVLDVPATFLETSASAMFLFALAEGVRHGWLQPRAAFAPAIDAAWAGLARAVAPNGTVAGICEGTPVLLDAAAYDARSTAYATSQSGLGAVFRAALAYHALR